MLEPVRPGNKNNFLGFPAKYDAGAPFLIIWGRGLSLITPILPLTSCKKFEKQLVLVNLWYLVA